MGLDGIHRVIAYGTVAVTLVGFGWSSILVVADRDGGPAFERFLAAAISALIVAAASGLVLLAVGARPAEGVKGSVGGNRLPPSAPKRPGTALLHS